MKEKYKQMKIENFKQRKKFQRGENLKIGRSGERKIV